MHFREIPVGGVVAFFIFFFFCVATKQFKCSARCISIATNLDKMVVGCCEWLSALCSFLKSMQIMSPSPPSPIMRFIITHFLHSSLWPARVFFFRPDHQFQIKYAHTTAPLPPPLFPSPLALPRLTIESLTKNYRANFL